MKLLNLNQDVRIVGSAFSVLISMLHFVSSFRTINWNQMFLLRLLSGIT